MHIEKTSTDGRFSGKEHDGEFLISGPLLAGILRQKGPLWALLGLCAFALLLTAALWVVPLSYTSTTSIAIQSPSPNPLSGILSLPPQGARYLGILKSRSAATKVEQQIHLQKLYHLPTAEAAVGMLQGGIKAQDDPADGLLYVNVSLPALPRLRPHSAQNGKQVRVAAAQAANAYAAALQHYYATDDTDRETLLLRAADEQERSARADYDDALTRALDFARGRDFDPHTASIASGDPLSAAPADLSGLYTALFQTEEQIRQLRVENDVTQNKRRLQLGGIADLSAEDPLLTDARGRVSRDRAGLQTLSAVYGDDNPRVITARAQLQVDQAELARQTQGIRENLTTDQVNRAAQLEGLYARLGKTQAQIALSERRLGRSRVLSGEYGRLQQEVSFRADILKTTSDEAVRVRLGNVSAKNRMQVIDEAIPADKPSPGLLLPAAAALLLVLAGVMAALTREYLARAGRLTALPAPEYNTNGVLHVKENDLMTKV